MNYKRSKFAIIATIMAVMCFSSAFQANASLAHTGNISAATTMVVTGQPLAISFSGLTASSTYYFIVNATGVTAVSYSFTTSASADDVSYIWIAEKPTASAVILYLTSASTGSNAVDSVSIVVQDVETYAPISLFIAIGVIAMIIGLVVSLVKSKFM